MLRTHTPPLLTLTLILLTACQTPKGNGNHLNQPQRTSTQRTCWHNLPTSPPHPNRAPTTFILAAGANTGKLTKTNQDARQFTQAMQNRYHIPNQQTCLLQDVYRAEFATALRQLKPHLKPNDRVIIFFSGHGSYVKDDNGDETTDRFDEVLIPLDIKNLTMPTRSQVLTDDHLVQLINALPTQHILTFIDACYSSGMYMNANTAREKFLKKGQLAPSPRPLIQTNTRTTGAFTHLKGIILAAASEYQPAWEDRIGGIFTTTFLQALKRHPKANLRQLFQDTTARMQNTRRSQQLQQPEMKGNISLEIWN